MNIMNRFNVDIPAAVTVAHRPFILAAPRGYRPQCRACAYSAVNAHIRIFSHRTRAAAGSARVGAEEEEEEVVVAQRQRSRGNHASSRSMGCMCCLLRVKACSVRPLVMFHKATSSARGDEMSTTII